MARQTISCPFIPFTIIFSLFILLPSLRHTYVTASTSSSNNSDDAIRLLHDMIDPLDKRVRPVLNQSEPIKVYVTVNFVNLIDIDEVNQRITNNLWVNFSWWDELRTWNPDDYGGNDVIHPKTTDIWRPKTIITNSAGERDIFQDIDSPLSIYSSGATRWYAGGIFYSVCLMDLTYFPFDTQECTLNVMSTNLGSEIEFIPVFPTFLAVDYIANGEWSLKKSEVDPKPYPVGPGETLTFLYLSVTFERRPIFYLINILIPTMCLSFLSLFGFVVPKDSGERASFAITVLLSLAVYMGSVSGQLPANSDTFPLISVYIFSLLCLSMLSVLIIVLQMRMAGACDSEDTKNYQCDERNPLSNEKTKSHEENESKISMEAFDGENANTRSRFSNRVIPRHNSVNNKEQRISKGDHNDKTGNSVDPNNDKTGIGSLWNRTSGMYSSTTWSERIKNLILKHDDMVLMAIFTIMWAVFTIVFVSQIAGQ